MPEINFLSKDRFTVKSDDGRPHEWNCQLCGQRFVDEDFHRALYRLRVHLSIVHEIPWERHLDYREV